jgi:ParB family chromosome partitioning protein
MVAQRRVGLGRGLDALLPVSEPANESDQVLMIEVSSIHSNPYQPRKEFAEEELAELADSIREHGIIQPLIVVKGDNDQYTLVAGERRLRAATLVGLKQVPAVLRTGSDQDLLEIALIENIQRENLSPLETAQAYRRLEDSFKLTHEEIARRVGKKRVSVTNSIRLLKLSKPVQDALASKQISEGHARALVSLNSELLQESALRKILASNLNVRQTEELVRKLNGEKNKDAKTRSAKTPELISIEEQLMNSIGTKVTIHPGKTGGTIHVHYYSDEDLDNLIHRFSAK